MEKREQKEFSSMGFSMSDKAFTLLYMKLDGIGMTERGIYGYLVDLMQNQEKDNGLKDYAYPTKKRMMDDGEIAKGTLNKSLSKLKEFGIIEEKTIPNKRGGRPLKAYKPLPLLNPDQFLERYRDKLSVEKREQIEEYVKRSVVERVNVNDTAKSISEGAENDLATLSDEELRNWF